VGHRTKAGDTKENVDFSSNNANLRTKYKEELKAKYSHRKFETMRVIQSEREKLLASGEQEKFDQKLVEKFAEFKTGIVGKDDKKDAFLQADFQDIVTEALKQKNAKARALLSAALSTNPQIITAGGKFGGSNIKSNEKPTPTTTGPPVGNSKTATPVSSPKPPALVTEKDIKKVQLKKL